MIDVTNSLTLFVWPAPCAKSGLPPPFPPKDSVRAFITSPAEIFEVLSSVTPQTTATLLSITFIMIATPLLSSAFFLSANPVSYTHLTLPTKA